MHKARSVVRLLAATTTLALLAGAPRAQNCDPKWVPTFGASPGAAGEVRAAAVFDDGSGPALYIGGDFTQAGNVFASHVARWDGSAWSALGSGVGGTNATVRALAVFDDGSGPALYAGGSFVSAGGLAASNLAKWNGTSWSTIGAGLPGEVDSLGVFDDGSGPALFVGGVFTSVDGVTVNGLARWNGQAWSTLGNGPGGHVQAMAVFDDGSGPKLVVGGAVLSGVRRWSGSSWLSLGSGVGGTNAQVEALVVFDDGSGPALYAGGYFTLAGGQPAKYIARWRNSAWSAVGGGMNNEVHALLSFDDGSGPALFAGGTFGTAGGVSAAHLAKWNGASWSSVGNGCSDGVNALTALPTGGGTSLIAGGHFGKAGDVTADSVARWDGQHWWPVGNGLNNVVYALADFDFGRGPALCVGGLFTVADGVAANRIATWDGTSWSPLGLGMNGSVRALTVFDGGGGPSLYAGGEFTAADHAPASGIARWNGAGWSPVGGGVSGVVLTLASFDDGSGGGPQLYAGGELDLVSGWPTSFIARWNGTSWLPLGSGTDGDVVCMAGFDDGSGPALYVGGFFSSAGGVAATGIARWDGASWSPLGSGVAGQSSSVSALTVFDDGNGPALYAGGEFTSAGGVPARHVARWTGAGWSAVGSGVLGAVNCFRSFDDGTGRGSVLVEGSGFSVERWDGTSWSALGNGSFGGVNALTTFHAGGGGAADLCAGGNFSYVLGGDSFLARYAGCAAASGWLDLGDALPGAAGAPLLTGTGTLLGGEPVVLQLSNAAPSSAALLVVGLTSQPSPFKGGTLVPLPALLFMPLTTGFDGSVTLPASWPAGLPSGFTVDFQAAIADAGAVHGVALSNALQATTP